VTAPLWPAIRLAYGWVHQAAHLLEREALPSVEERRRQYRLLLATMSRERARVGTLEPAIAHFLKVTKSYWRGLFPCYEFPALPRTNNDLEQVFGSVRHHERRATGRKGAVPGTVVRGAVRLVAAVASRWCRFDPAQLCPPTPDAWVKLRQEVGQREEARRAQLRFRKDPTTYLKQAEQLLLRATLPV
jgi:hypothetical protein